MTTCFDGSRTRTLDRIASDSVSGRSPAVLRVASEELNRSMVGLRRGMATLSSEREFHLVADEELEEVHDAVEEALEEGFDDDFDCNIAVRPQHNFCPCSYRASYPYTSLRQ